jgi:hypothetical protein
MTVESHRGAAGPGRRVSRVAEKPPVVIARAPSALRQPGELEAAFKTALGHEGPCLIEADVDPTDCSPTMRKWGTRVAAANGKPPRA